MTMRLRATTLAQSLALFSVGMMLISPVAFTADFPYFRKATSVERLAKKIDELRKHIDEYGSVVAKHPDIWGESRLM
jgi:hypothetical protein